MAFLEIIAGPRAGTSFPLSDGREMLLGRDTACDVVLVSRMVSRRHARVYQDGNDFYVEDLGTINGTFLNSLRIEKPMPLQDGDRINLFDATLIFRADNANVVQLTAAPHAATTPPQVPDDEPRTETGETVIWRHETKPEWNAVQAEVRLQSILEIMRKLGSSLALNEVLPRVLDILFETFPHAVNGQILLLNARGELIPKAIKQGREDDSATFTLTPVSNAFAKQVIETGQVALFEESDEESVIAESYVASVTAPIIGPSQKALGVIHLECSSSDHRFDKSDVDLLTAVAAAGGQAVEYVRSHESLLASDRKRQELKMAREFQLQMLPSQQPTLPGYSFRDFYGAAEEVGGDFYGYFRASDNRVVVTIGDMVGKGLRAALHTAQFVSDIRHSVTEAGSLKRAMRRLNHIAYETDFRFITLLLCVVDSREHAVTIAQAGHPPPLLRRKRSNTVEVLQSERRGLPLGVESDQVFHPDTYRLEPGDLLLLYTDGATEAMDRDGRAYGFDRVRQALESIASGAAPLIRFLVADIVDFRKDNPPSDDICLVCLQRDEQEGQSGE